MISKQFSDHLLSTRYNLSLLEVAEVREFAVRAGRNASEGTDPFGDVIACQPEFVVLLLEHQVQPMEIGPMTFQWKLCVLKYSVNVSANTRDSASATCASSFSVIAFSIPIALDISFLLRLSSCKCFQLISLLNGLSITDYQPKVDSNTTKPCYHARMAGVFTVL
jgi:hypothetical protein